MLNISVRAIPSDELELKYPNEGGKFKFIVKVFCAGMKYSGSYRDTLSKSLSSFEKFE